MAAEQTCPDYFSGLLFPHVFKTFRMAVQPGKLAVALVALCVIAGAGWVMNFTGDVAVTRTGEDLMQTELEVYLRDMTVGKLRVEEFRGDATDSTGLGAVLWDTGIERFHDAVAGLLTLNPGEVFYCVRDCAAAVKWAFSYHPVHAIVLFVVSLMALTLAGGTICRIAAIQFGLGGRPGVRESFLFSVKKFSSNLSAPLAPVGIMLVLGGFITLFGLLGNIPYAGEMLVGLGGVLSLGIGVLITVVMIGLAGGFGLMFPAVAYDGSDCFDAISRSFSYVWGRPWRMALYTVMAAAYGAVCYLFVRLFAFILLSATRFFLEIGIWADSSSGEASKLGAIWPAPSYANLLGVSGITSMNWSESVGAFIIRLWVLAVGGLVVSFLISFFFTSQTIIYALLRKHVDRTAIDDVYSNVDGQDSELFDWDSEGSEVQAGGEKEGNAKSDEAESAGGSEGR